MTGRTAGGWHATAGSSAVSALVPEGQDPVTTGLQLLRQGSFAEAIASFERASRERPSDPVVWFYLARANHIDTKLGEAEKAYREALRLEQGLAEAWLQLSNMYVEQGRLPEALEALRSLARVRGRGPMLAYQEGFVLSKMGRFQEAEGMLQGSLRLKPDNTDAWYILGVNSQRSGDNEAAVKAFERCLGLDPEYADAWFNKGNALARLGRMEEAQEALGRFAAVNEARERRLALESNLRVLQKGAEMDLLEGRLETVEGQAAEAEQVQPGMPWTYRVRAELLLAQGRPDEALEKLREGAARNPVEAEEHLALAEAFRRAGDGEAADHHESIARGMLLDGGRP
jgi:tetratricopeptide (TPR) repeat protein